MKSTESVIKWVAKASINGLHRVMSDLCMREYDLSKTELAEMETLIKRDLLRTTAAKVSAAEDQDLSTYDVEVGKFIAAAKWTDLKRVIHAVNLRLGELPKDQVGELQSMLFGEQIVKELGLEFLADKQHFTAGVSA